MKIHPYIIFLLTISIGLISCEKEATIDPPRASPKLVVAAFISPQDTLIRIDISKSIPVFGTRTYGNHGSDEVITDATVILSDGNSSVTLSFDSKEGRYTVDSNLFKIQAGKTYFLNVSTPDGLKADAQCTVPQSNNTFTLGELDSTYSENSRNYKITFRWEDNPLTVDYYAFDGQVFLYMEGQRRFGSPLSIQEDKYIADTQISSGSIIRKGEFQVWGPQGMKREIHGYLLSTDVHYYKYHKGIQNGSGDNPFAEPVLLYSNVNGGLGVFCSYNLKTVIKEYNF